MQKFKDGILRKLIVVCETHLERNVYSKYIVGSSITIADFALASLTFNILKNEQSPFYTVVKDIFMEFPFFGAYTKRLQSELRRHLSSRE